MLLVTEDDGVPAAFEDDVEVAPVDGLLRPPAVDDPPLLANKRDRDSVHSADVPYSDLLPSLFQLNAGYFLIQCASERDKDPVYRQIGEHSRDDANEPNTTGAPGRTSCTNAMPASASASVCAATPAVVTGAIAPVPAHRCRLTERRR